MQKEGTIPEGFEVPKFVTLSVTFFRRRYDIIMLRKTETYL